MLFSSSLIAEVLPRLWERDPEAARQSLEELRLLNRGASAEMRSLLVELRPAALAEARLEELLRQLAEAMTARTRVPIRLTVEGDRPVPPNVQIALYRIAQEALTNAAKHAQARHVGMVLQTRPEDIELTICDDGRGFDPRAVKPGHFGLNTMQERAEEIGASLSITSRPGKGTEVVVRWPE
jgi:signal transduction histidine kinase